MPLFLSLALLASPALFPGGSLCYNRRAVERAAKQELAQLPGQTALAADVPAAPSLEGRSAATPAEDASWYCPVCSQRLESRHCKWICSRCGYYMSCEDYH